ncbi:ELWxxDGT repeat protein [Flavobacterium sp. YJ01]|uniref:ELWxxDGT repeat protein n=1 Tax=unclassified Flavobacterium TaxID=196869 RepID=UPI0023E3E808|nr:ELWxxDGT repeat protein [Flavobacterium sp. YJ01]WET01866.1 T9SS type A sorting domain-containing protein [Flavobacterium sp. YJ01]
MKYNFTLLLLVTIINFSFAQTIDATLLEINFQESSYPQNLTPFKSGFCFTATDGYNKKFGRELWYSDGTKNGTKMIKDILPGSENSSISNLIQVNNILYFSANDGVHGAELWKSDGTEAGTLMVKDINPNDKEVFYAPTSMVEFNGKLYFSANNGINGYELWTSDGTEAGTYMVKDINPNSGSNPNELFVFNNSLYFIANNSTGNVLWKSDGTEAGTVILKNVYLNTLSNNNKQFLITNDRFYFYASDRSKGFELWKSDGSESGTQMVKDIRAGINPSANSLRGSVLNNTIIFEANDGINGNEIWKSDGTESGTFMLKNIDNSLDNSIFGEGKYVTFNNEVFFLASQNLQGSDIWKTDGTSNGTVLFKRVNDGNNFLFINKFFHDKINNKLLFFINSTNNSDKTIWVSDGTSNGTKELSNIKSNDSFGYPDNFISINNKTIFNAESKKYGNELWQTDGTTLGTSLFADLNFSNGSNPAKFTNVNGNLFFRARGTESGSQLFKSDGTIEGTKLVKDLNPGSETIDDLSDMKEIKGTLFFSGIDGTHGFELWKSDGTENGTTLVKDIFPGINSGLRSNSGKQEFSVINDILYFNANDGANGFELWKSDGTEAGTYMIKDIYPGSSASYARQFVLLNNIIYFIANDNSGTAIWKTDGTQSGTTKIIALNDIRILKILNNKLIIIAETSGTTYGPHDVWVSDGTAIGTKHLKTFGDNGDSEIEFTTTMGNQLYFVARSPDSFRKAVYKTDGTIEGTKLVFDGANHPTMPNLKIKEILTCGSYVYFVVSDFYNTNKELWRTNNQVTEKVADSDTEDFLNIRSLITYNDNLFYLTELFPKKIWMINDNLNTSEHLSINVLNGKNLDGRDSVQGLAVTNNNLYFNANNEISGNELYLAKINSPSLSIPDYYLSEKKNQKEIKVYPNPANKFVTIESKNSNITKFELYNMLGQKIDEQMSKDSNQKIKYDLNNLVNGIYFIKATLSNGKIDNVKLIVN